MQATNLSFLVGDAEPLRLSTSLIRFPLVKVLQKKKILYFKSYRSYTLSFKIFWSIVSYLRFYDRFFLIIV